MYDNKQERNLFIPLSCEKGFCVSPEKILFLLYLKEVVSYPLFNHTFKLL